MQHFPIFLNLDHQRVIVSGGAETALAKLRLLMKTNADIHVFHPTPISNLVELENAGKITLHKRFFETNDAVNARLFYGANDDETLDRQHAEWAKSAGVLINVVDNLEASEFITPAIVDRDPVTIAIGTEGSAPVLARQIKSELETRLSPDLGTLARIGKSFRSMADRLPMGAIRREFWAEYYTSVGPKSLPQGAAHVKQALNNLLDRFLEHSPKQGFVSFVGAGPGDPELLTLKARKEIERADVVIYDRLVGDGILELARREALMIDVGKTGFGPSASQTDINALIAEHAENGSYVVRLKGGDSTVFGRLDEEIDTLTQAGIDWDIVPGITSASAAVAAIGQSLTRRTRNTAVRFLTGHDMQGFADHDWASLANTGEVAAIYMGKKSAPFISGRLLMHGADAQTPVTLVENASRSNQRIIAVTLADLPDCFRTHALRGPVMTLLGLHPRKEHEIFQTLNIKLGTA